MCEQTLTDEGPNFYFRFLPSKNDHENTISPDLTFILEITLPSTA